MIKYLLIVYASKHGQAEKIARRAMEVAAEVCVFTNGRVTVETI